MLDSDHKYTVSKLKNGITVLTESSSIPRNVSLGNQFYFLKWRHPLEYRFKRRINWDEWSLAIFEKHFPENHFEYKWNDKLVFNENITNLLAELYRCQEDPSRWTIIRKLVTIRQPVFPMMSWICLIWWLIARLNQNR